MKTFAARVRATKSIGIPGSQWGSLFEGLATQVALAPPVRPKPQTQDELLGLFSADTVGRNVVLQPATTFDMMGLRRCGQAQP